MPLSIPTMQKTDPHLHSNNYLPHISLVLRLILNYTREVGKQSPGQPISRSALPQSLPFSLFLNTSYQLLTQKLIPYTPTQVKSLILFRNQLEE